MYSNSKLASEDNVYKDAVKKRKLDTTHSKSGRLKNPNPSFYSATQNPQPLVTPKQYPISCQVSIEEVNYKDDHIHYHAGPPKDPNIILGQLADNSDE